MSRDELIDTLERDWNVPGRWEQLEGTIEAITGKSMDEIDDSDPDEGMYAEISDEDLEEILNRLSGKQKAQAVGQVDLTAPELRLLKRAMEYWSDPSFSRDAAESWVARDLLKKLNAVRW